MTTLKTVIYMGVMHGVFTYYIPWQMGQFHIFHFDADPFRYGAFLFWSTGTFGIIHCSIDVIRRGLGTPAHLDPPQKLIITGLYRYVRNPIYLAALLVLTGYILWFGSGLLLVYFLFFVLAYNILVILIEEPVLRNTFGEEYAAYCRHVSRWIPKLVRDS